MEKASPSPSRSESFSRGGRWLRSGKVRVAPSLERLDVVVDAASLGESFNSSNASFIDMDPAELFSMRWTSSDEAGLPMLASASGDLLLPCDQTGIASRDDSGMAYADAVSTPSSPMFHTAQSTPACASRRGNKPRTAPLTATRRMLLRYLRFLVPLCRKARSLAPRSGGRALAAPTVTPTRRSTSSMSSAEHWCHGNADTAVRDAILYCKKSFTARSEC